MNFANLMQGMGPNLLDAVGQGVLWGIMVLGVYITFKLLDIADLTVDGACTGRLRLCHADCGQGNESGGSPVYSHPGRNGGGFCDRHPSHGI